MPIVRQSPKSISVQFKLIVHTDYVVYTEYVVFNDLHVNTRANRYQNVLSIRTNM